MAQAKSTKKKQRRSVPSGQLHVQATFNNTIVTFADSKGNVLTAASAGAEKAAEAAKSSYGIRTVDVFVKGVGLGRDAAIRAMAGFDIAVNSIKDVTGVPHGGVRPRKARRA